jgi:hypothetical protein
MDKLAEETNYLWVELVIAELPTDKMVENKIVIFNTTDKFVTKSSGN